MKLKSSYFFFFSMVLLGSLSMTSALGQENDPAINEYKETNQSQPELIISDEKSGIAEHDHTFKVRDSVHTRSLVPVVKVKGSDQAKPSSNKEDDALSFNFLYYIIQKFKISDLIDD